MSKIPDWAIAPIVILALLVVLAISVPLVRWAFPPPKETPEQKLTSQYAERIQIAEKRSIDLEEKLSSALQANARLKSEIDHLLAMKMAEKKFNDLVKTKNDEDKERLHDLKADIFARETKVKDREIAAAQKEKDLKFGELDRVRERNIELEEEIKAFKKRESDFEKKYNPLIFEEVSKKIAPLIKKEFFKDDYLLAVGFILGLPKNLKDDALIKFSDAINMEIYLRGIELLLDKGKSVDKRSVIIQKPQPYTDKEKLAILSLYEMRWKTKVTPEYLKKVKITAPSSLP